MEKEIWKDIPQYEGVYQVSSLGRIRSLDREVTYIDGRFYKYKGNLIKTRVYKKGYPQLTLQLNKVNKHFLVHQLVAMAFLGHIPNGHKVEINHKDRDKLNNKLSNLELLTKEEHDSKTWGDGRPGCSSKYRGVSFHKVAKKWAANIRVNGKKKHIGYFTKEIDAHNAYQKKLKEIKNNC